MRRRHVVTAALLVLATAGTAAAWWTAGGNGSATASSEVPVAVTLTPGSPGDPLHPGAAVDLVLTAANPNGSVALLGPLALDTVQGDGGFTIDADHPGCPASSFALVAASYDGGGEGWTVPAGGTLEVVLPQALTMSFDAPDACQGASVTVHVRDAS